MGRLTTHILDTAHGVPAAGMAITLLYQDADGWQALKAVSSNADGRCDAPLLEAAAFRHGRYRLVFAAADYFAEMGVRQTDPAFLDTVVIEFGISDPSQHYHVPLLISPFGYSTYRGS